MEYKTDWSIEGGVDNLLEMARYLASKVDYKYTDGCLVNMTFEHILTGDLYKSTMGIEYMESKRKNHFVLPQDKEKALDYILCRDSDEKLTKGEVYYTEDYGDDWFGIFRHLEIGRYERGMYRSISTYFSMHISEDGRFNESRSLCYKCNERTYRKATPDEIKWLEACEKAGEFVSKEEALKESEGESIINIPDPTTCKKNNYIIGADPYKDLFPPHYQKICAKFGDFLGLSNDKSEKYLDKSNKDITFDNEDIELIKTTEVKLLNFEDDE
jgi:hypothetical protein